MIPARIDGGGRCRERDIACNYRRGRGGGGELAPPSAAAVKGWWRSGNRGSMAQVKTSSQTKEMMGLRERGPWKDVPTV
ncbi:unnamed protein product [Lampetra planeri]